MVSSKGSKVLDLEHNDKVEATKGADGRPSPQVKCKMGPMVSSGGTVANGENGISERNTGSRIRHDNPRIQKQLDIAAGKLQQQLKPKQKNVKKK